MAEDKTGFSFSEENLLYWKMDKAIEDLLNVAEKLSDSVVSHNGILNEESMESLYPVYNQISELGDILFLIGSNQQHYAYDDYVVVCLFRNEFTSYLDGEISTRHLLRTISSIYVYGKSRHEIGDFQKAQSNDLHSNSSVTGVLDILDLINKVRDDLVTANETCTRTNNRNIDSLAEFTVINYLVSDIENISEQREPLLRELCDKLNKEEGKYLKHGTSKFSYVIHLLNCWESIEKKWMELLATPAHPTYTSEYHKDTQNDAEYATMGEHPLAKSITVGVRELVKHYSKVPSIDQATDEFINRSVVHLVECASLINTGK